MIYKYDEINHYSIVTNLTTMVNYERSFKTNLPRFQPMVERAFGLELGTIGIYPVELYEQREGHKPSAIIAARAGVHGLYYPGIEHTMDYDDVEAQVTEFHELAHVAQIRHSGATDMTTFLSMRHAPDIPYWVDEGFAEFMAVEFMRLRGIEPTPNRHYVHYYDRMVEAVRDHKLKTPRQILEFAATHRI
jgi:hypothetical protein